VGGFLHLVFYTLKDKTVSTNAKIEKQTKAIIGGQLLLLKITQTFPDNNLKYLSNTYKPYGFIHQI
jgi:hypothetical protein